MKSSDLKGITSLLTFIFTLIAIASFSQGLNFNRALGNLTSQSLEQNVFNGATSSGKFRVTVWSPSIIRIQITQGENFSDFSYAVVAKPEMCKASIKDEAAQLTLSTDSVDLIIKKSPVRFVLLTKTGKVISQDDPAFGTSWLGEEVTTYKSLQEGERFIGLGEKTGNLDRHGQAYTNWNTDYFAYPLSADAIYMTIPFYVGVHHDIVYGIFMDNSSKSNFNFGASNNRFSSFTAEEGEMNYYLIYHRTMADIIQSYTSLTGRMQMPPLWSLGLQQSRYSYYPDSQVLSIAKTFRDKGIPADVIYLDIHYMDKYKIFSWDKARFPDPKKMTTTLKSMGFHTAVILDPGIKVEKNYEPYDDGIKQDVFLKYPDNTYYTGEVWPGWCHFPDFTNPRVRTWWGAKFSGYIDDGIEGFWNDMNEPATWGQSTPNLVEFSFEGKKATHRTARNIYGLNMTRSTFEGTKKLMNGKRPFILTRSGYAGIQRYSAVWTGDNVASDEHMMLGVRLINSLGVTGVPVTGMDVGGFSGGASEKLFARWISIGAFSPFFRIHAKDNSRAQEPWSYGEQTEAIVKNYVSLRYKLIPYIYSTFYEATLNGMPVNRSLAISHPFEPMVYDLRYQHEFLFGSSILVAPGESTKDYYKVYLPDHDWYDLYTDKYYEGKQEIIAEASVDHLPLFIKGGSIIPMQSVVQNLSESPEEVLNVHIYKGNGTNRFVYYEDDGISNEYQAHKFYKRAIRYDGEKNSLAFEKAEGDSPSKFTKIKLNMHGFKNLKPFSGGKRPAIGSEKIELSAGSPVIIQSFVIQNLSQEMTIDLEGK